MTFLLEPLFPEDRSIELDNRHQVVLDLLGKMVAEVVRNARRNQFAPG